jgi:Fe-S-cluster containining protein
MADRLGISAASSEPHPCLTCGACCAHYRVSFYWSEAEARGVPEPLFEQVNPWMACMVGTGEKPVRCAALQGEVGKGVSCSIYAQRPSPCRSVEIGDERCIAARAAYGMPDLVWNGC